MDLLIPFYGSCNCDSDQAVQLKDLIAFSDIPTISGKQNYAFVSGEDELGQYMNTSDTRQTSKGWRLSCCLNGFFV